MSTKDGTTETIKMEMTNLGSSGASTEEAALVSEEKALVTEEKDGELRPDNIATKQGGANVDKNIDPATVVGTKEFHQRPHLLKLTFKSVCLGLTPCIFLIIMIIFGLIVYNIAQSEITPSPTMEPTMSPITTITPTAGPTMEPTMAPTSLIDAFNSRREMLIDYVLTDQGPNLILDAFRGNTLDQTQLDSKKGEMIKENADFDLIDLVRLLYLTDGSYDNEILESINGTVTPFWVTDGDIVQYYWTENHLIMWDSCAYLLKQKFPNIETNDNIYNRIVSYLQLKINYGYFALNAAIYAPFKVAALLNLADFSQDTMIKNLAIQALDVLLLEIIDNVNSEGAFYPAMGRGVDSKYSDSTDMFGGTISQMNYLLTGLGPIPTDAPLHLITTNVNNIASILGSYREIIDGEVNVYGIPIESFDDFNDQTNYPLTTDDRTIFQLSANLYWIPETVANTIAFVNKYNIWNHDDFVQWQFFQDPVGQTGLTVEQLGPFTEGTAINQVTNVLFKHGPAMLSSFQAYHFRYLGHQQYVWAATTGTVAIWSKSGDGSPAGFENVHLPNVNQTKNVALIVYDSLLMNSDPYKSLLGALGSVTDITNVYIHLNDNEFDEVRTYQNWILAMEIGSNGVNGYVGLRRDSNCTNPIVNNVIVCNASEQAWGVIVGSSAKYGTFDDFQSVVENSNYDELENRLTIDGISIEYGQFVSDRR